MKPFSNLAINHIHFTGIKGVGMTALALCAKDLGIKITGSDLSERFVTDETLKKANVSWKIGFKKEHIGNPDLLVYTAAHGGKDNIEVKEAIKKEIKVMSHAEALGFFMQDKEGIAVSGVGGKTTTASMITTIFDKAKLNPSWAIGVGWINPLGFPGKYNRKSNYFIAEADEYFTSPQDATPRFLYLNPKIIVITNIEHDHPDVYKDIWATISAFEKFVYKLGKDGLLIANIDDKNVKHLLQSIKVKTLTFGTSKKADYKFNLINKIKLKVPGRFNAYNALAAFAVADYCGISFADIKKGLESFGGSRRRFEFIKEIGGIKIYDDYAHHPLEVKATLRAVTKQISHKRIIAIFQPHTYSRTKTLLNDFAKSFEHTDVVLVTEIYASAREKKDKTISGKILAEKIKENKSKVFFKKGKKEVADFLQKESRKGDVIITMGAGDIFNWHNSIIKKIKGNRRPKTENRV